jgi:hypothetical protein
MQQIDHADDYEDAAEFIALRHDMPIGADLIRALYRFHPHVLEAIECNPHEWAQRVRDYCYANAMEAHHDSH